MRRELVGWLIIALWIAAVTAFAVNFDPDTHFRFGINNVVVFRSVGQLFLAIFAVAALFNLLLLALLALGRRSGTMKKFVFLLLAGLAVCLFVLFTRITVDYRFIFSVDQLTGGVTAVLLFVGGAIVLVIIRLVQVAMLRR